MEILSVSLGQIANILGFERQKAKSEYKVDIYILFYKNIIIENFNSTDILRENIILGES